MKQRKHFDVKDYPFYPGSANQRYFINKARETVTAIASGMGFLTLMIFFLLM